MSLDELISMFRSEAPDKEEEVIYYQEVALTIRKIGDEGVDFLLTERTNADEARTRALLLALTYPSLDNDDVNNWIAGFLKDTRESIVMDAIDSLSRQKQASRKVNVLQYKNHRSPYIRGAVLRYMRTLFPEESIPLLKEGVRDSNFIVRDVAADEIGELGKVELKDDLLPLLNDPHPDVREAAQTALDMLEETDIDQVFPPTR